MLLGKHHSYLDYLTHYLHLFPILLDLVGHQAGRDAVCPYTRGCSGRRCSGVAMQNWSCWV